MADDHFNQVVAIMRKALVQKRADRDPGSDADILLLVIADLDFDSLDKMELVMNIEDNLRIELDELAVQRCVTVADLASLAQASA